MSGSATPAGRRPEWADLEPARAEDATGLLNLADNTNRFGSPPAAIAALHAIGSADPAEYPSAYGEPLKDVFAAYAGVRASQIVTGCGSDDVLDSAIRAFGRPGERFAALTPTFPMAARCARLNGLEVAHTVLAGDGTFDASALLASDPAIVYLCTPNNPTGAALDPAAVEHVIANARGVVIIDEAYAEFCGGDHARTAPARGNVLAVRTMSKAFGLAGLRVGWATATEALVREVEISRGPYKLSSPAERAVREVFAHDLDWVRDHAAKAVAARERFVEALRALGLSPLPSAANFVLVPRPGARAVALGLRERGIAVRAFDALPGIGDALRIGVAPWRQLERALAALKEVLACA